jgi:hypothetical protein
MRLKQFGGQQAGIRELEKHYLVPASYECSSSQQWHFNISFCNPPPIHTALGTPCGESPMACYIAASKVRSAPEAGGIGHAHAIED